MLHIRVIPSLLLKNGGLVKTVNFKNSNYVGDPINTVRIFNEKEVDELILLDIEASKKNKEPNFELIEDIVSEAFMPIAYGGGIKTVKEAQKIVSLGVEKIIVNSVALSNPNVVSLISDRLGSSSTIVAIDIKKDIFGRYCLYNAAIDKIVNINPLDHIQQVVNVGAGEIFINDISREGTGKGYDLKLVQTVCSSVNVPIIICGGASNLNHFKEAVEAGASAVAAGSMFVYLGKHRAVMINYPKRKILEGLFEND